MTTGAVIMAFNNESVDYVKLAAWSAHNIKRHLGIPVCLITNEDKVPSGFDRVVHTQVVSEHQRYFEDLNQSVTWHNVNRADVYDLSPWDQTLLLDADYVVASDQLRCVLDSKQEFLCHDRAYGIGKCIDDLNYFGDCRMPMWWATVIMFRRGHVSRMIFDCMKMIKNHWRHYLDLYNIHRGTYRNDYAVSIALNIMSGHTLQINSIPWALATVTPEQKLIEKDQDSYQITFVDSHTRSKTVCWKNQDFHAMGKQHLGDIIEASG